MHQFNLIPRWSFAALLLLELVGCADLAYYRQSVLGHAQIMRAAKPISQWMSDQQVSPTLKERLALAQRMREFAVTELALPDNASYHRYADLQRRSALWNVVAAPEWSLKLTDWCFVIVGCVSYRGYYDETEARAQGDLLQGNGLEVSVYEVPAYSTLGLMNWAGGDPLLNTFINYSAGDLARLIFHELAHQVVYVRNDTRFNEAFATAVERLGSAQWMQRNGSEQAKAQFAQFNSRRSQFRALTQSTRRALQGIYTHMDPSVAPKSLQIVMKAQVMQDFRDQYAVLKKGWASELGASPANLAGLDIWVAKANNASFGAQGVYDDLVPHFEAMFALESRGSTGVQAWRKFFDAVKRLADLSPELRAKALE